LGPARIITPSSIFVGNDVLILDQSWISVIAAVEGVVPRLVFGSGCRIGRFLTVACVGEIAVGEGVLVGERVFLGDTYHRYQDPGLAIIDQPMAEPEPVKIGRAAVIGTNAAILAGVTIGEQAYVAPGAVVVHDVAPDTLVAGNPARPIADFDRTTEQWNHRSS
jgi:acetyltransferase-like isoleucine patch superfamily enzyme